MATDSDIRFSPLTLDRWSDFQALFLEKRGELPVGENLAGGGCWCMEFRLPPEQWLRGQGEENRLAMRSLVDSGEVPGLLAYADGVIAGWCSVAPRSRFPGLEYRRALQPIDDEPVWSIVCFFVARDFRGRGLMASLLGEALDFARERGASIVEAYPKEVPSVELAAGFRGFVSTLRKAGFVEVARRRPAEPIMRYYFGGSDASVSRS